MNKEPNPKRPAPIEILKGAMPGLEDVDPEELVNEGVSGEGENTIVIDDVDFCPPEANDGQAYL